MESKGLSDGGDRFRTTGIRIGVGDFHLRINLYTGDPTAPDGTRPTDKTGRETYSHPAADDYRAGVLSFGYRNYSIGLNSEIIRHIFQNVIAHDVLRGKKMLGLE